MRTTPAKRLTFSTTLATVVTAIALAVTATAAWAAWYTDNLHPTIYWDAYCYDDPEGGNGSITCQTDNSTLTYYMDSGGDYELESADQTHVRNVMTDEFAPTDLSVSYDSTPTFSGSAETDIIYQEGSANVPSSADGVTWCNDAVDGELWACDQQYIRIRGAGPYSNEGLICHETGHAVGLLHGAQSAPSKNDDDENLGCMETPVSSGEGLQSNQRENINENY